MGTQAQATFQWDIRSVPKPDNFSGREEDWNEWKFGFRSYAHLMGLTAEMDGAAQLPDPPMAADMEVGTKARSSMLFHLLVQLLK